MFFDISSIDSDQPTYNFSNDSHYNKIIGKIVK